MSDKNLEKLSFLQIKENNLSILDFFLNYDSITVIL